MNERKRIAHFIGFATEMVVEIMRKRTFFLTEKGRVCSTLRAEKKASHKQKFSDGTAQDRKNKNDFPIAPCQAMGIPILSP